MRARPWASQCEPNPEPPPRTPPHPSPPRSAQRGGGPRWGGSNSHTGDWHRRVWYAICPRHKHTDCQLLGVPPHRFLRTHYPVTRAPPALCPCMPGLGTKPHQHQCMPTCCIPEGPCYAKLPCYVCRLKQRGGPRPLGNDVTGGQAGSDAAAGGGEALRVSPKVSEPPTVRMARNRFWSSGA